MRSHLLCALALGLIASATAAAAQDSDTITVRTKVSPYCKDTGAAPPPLALGALADGNGFVVSSFAGPTSYTLSGYYCNGPTSITLAAAPLLQTAGTTVLDTSSFTNRIDYQATLDWVDVDGTANSTASSPTVITASQANLGDLVVSVSAPDTAGNLRPISGDYAGAVTLTITLD
ncbi:MAG: hypothetical protein GC145_02645 [Caulobacter sp.]|nr:hypothetical protein [Caulobacter sp.]